MHTLNSVSAILNRNAPLSPLIYTCTYKVLTVQGLHYNSESWQKLSLQVVAIGCVQISLLKHFHNQTKTYRMCWA